MIDENSNLSKLPEGWLWTRLGEVCLDPQYGWTTSAAVKGSLHLLRTTDITAGDIHWDSVPFCKQEPPEKQKYLVKDGDIVISRAGSVGYSRLIRIPKEAVFASYLIRFRPLVDEAYLAYFLKSPSYWESISEKSLGIAIPNVNASKLKQVVVPLAPLPEQHRIAAKIEELFTRLDAGVEGLKKVKAQLKHYRQAILKNAFEGKLTEEWREAHKGQLEPAYVLLERIKEERAKSAKGRYNEPPPLDTCDLPELTEGWVWTSLGELAALNPKFMDDIPDELEVSFIPMKCVEELTGQVDLSLTKLYSEVKKGYTAFRNGDVLFAKITPCMENGKVSIVNNLKNGIGFGSTEFHVIRLNSGQMPNRFVFFFLVRESFRRDARMHMTGSAGQLRVPKIYLEEVPIPLPPLTEQHKIVEEIERCLSVADAIGKDVEQSLKQAERLRQSILKRAFEGKLVLQDPTDEPAEKLLEHIRAERARIEAEKKLNTVQGRLM